MNKITIGKNEKAGLRRREIFRTLRTNIEFTGVENRVIAVTSCVPNDGKTSISYQLACAFAEAGKTALLIDADMRRSVMVSRLQMEGQQKGLSHFLSGQAEITEVLYSTNKKNIYMIPSGVFPVNPTELLGNERFKKLIAAVKESFQYVILDTPPLGSVIDAAVAAQQCDGIILVLAAGETSRKLARAVTDQLQAADVKILGTVLNKIQVQNSRYGKYYGMYYGTYNEEKRSGRENKGRAAGRSGKGQENHGTKV